MVLNPTLSAISTTLYWLPTNNWAARFKRMDRINWRGFIFRMTVNFRFRCVLLKPRSLLKSSNEYSESSIFFSTKATAFFTNSSSKEVVVISLGVISMFFLNVSFLVSRCSISFCTRTCNISKLKGFEIYESAPAL